MGDWVSLITGLGVSCLLQWTVLYQTGYPNTDVCVDKKIMTNMGEVSVETNTKWEVVSVETNTKWEPVSVETSTKWKNK